MKKTFILILLGLIGFNLNAQRRIKTVNNDPLAPGQYTTLQAAINAAVAGDTIYVGATLTPYGNVTISKKLTLMGAAGGNPDSNGKTSRIGKVSFTAAAKGSELNGLSIILDYRLIEATNGTSNITIRNCYLQSNNDYFFSIDDCDSWLIEGNSTHSMHGFALTSNSDNIVFKNNQLSNYYRAIQNANQTTLIFNNVFHEASGELNQFEGCTNSMVYNNIFYFENAIENFAPDTGCSGCSFSNNITFATNLALDAKVLADIPGAGNFGGNNINNQGPMILNNYWVENGSPAKNAGSDGTDLGAYGGYYKFVYYGYSNLPQMNYLMIKNTVVPVNGTLNVNLKAHKQN